MFINKREVMFTQKAHARQKKVIIRHNLLLFYFAICEDQDFLRTKVFHLTTVLSPAWQLICSQRVTSLEAYSAHKSG
jgi:hypothetical protein